MELAGWPEIYVFFAREYHFPPREVNELTLIQMCILLGAITPDHEIKRLPGDDEARLTGTPENKRNYRKFHLPKRRARIEQDRAEREERRAKRPQRRPRKQ